MIAFSSHLRYFLCTSPVDMRNSFDGLCGIVRQKLQKDPISSSVFIFFNKPRTHLKVLFWDGDGFVLYYKRLERGTFHPRTTDCEPSIQIGKEELMMFLEGLSFEKIRKSKRFKM